VFHEISSPPWRVQNCDHWIAPTSRSGGCSLIKQPLRPLGYVGGAAHEVLGKNAGEFGDRHLEPRPAAWR
jgi:hypothetical protein